MKATLSGDGILYWIDNGFHHGWNMAKNRVQFQKDLSFQDFQKLFGTLAQCRENMLCYRQHQRGSLSGLRSQPVLPVVGREVSKPCLTPSVLIWGVRQHRLAPDVQILRMMMEQDDSRPLLDSRVQNDDAYWGGERRGGKRRRGAPVQVSDPR